MLRAWVEAPVETTRWQRTRVEMFRDLEGTAEAVMLGDPLTESGPRSELLLA
jgi:hypothetical protein